MSTLQPSTAFATKPGPFISNFQLSTFNSAQRRGISLMEVLASTFVISIGLLGVLAVIPFGAFQVSKARDAEHCANMLNAAKAELKTRELAKPEKWRGGQDVDSIGVGTADNSFTDITTPKFIFIRSYAFGGGNEPSLNNTRFIMVDPFDTSGTQNPDIRIVKAGRNFFNPDIWREQMRGQDDLEYTTHQDRRTEFNGPNNTAVSSGKYSWFFTFRPEVEDPTSLPAGDVDNTQKLVALKAIKGTATVDILGCYNRTAGDERSVTISAWSNYQNATNLTLQSSSSAADLDLTNIRSIFVTWTVRETYSDGGTSTGTFDVPSGVWCKVVHATDIVLSSGNYERSVFVTSKLPDFSTLTPAPNPRALLVPGVLYHKSSSVDIK